MSLTPGANARQPGAESLGSVAGRVHSYATAYTVPSTGELFEMMGAGRWAGASSAPASAARRGVLVMPPRKGNFAATNMVLSLFVGQPETVGSIRRRLNREYAEARWSRSIVDHAIPALESQGFITLIEAGKKPQDRIYEITAAGKEEFRRWVRESSREPVPIREPLQLWIEHSTPDELPALLAIIKESEEAAKQKLAMAKRHLDAERERGRFGPSDSSDWNGRIRYAISHDRVLYWGGRVARFMAMRQILRAQRERHQRIPEAGDAHA